jgi:hypothetical protein
VGFHPKVAILNGKPRVRSTASLLCSNGGKYDSASKRYESLMCQACLHGTHATCKSKDCPCSCNDSELSFQRNRLTAIGALPPDPELEALLAIRPDLESLVDA